MLLESFLNLVVLFQQSLSVGKGFRVFTFCLFFCAALFVKLKAKFLYSLLNSLGVFLDLLIGWIVGFTGTLWSSLILFRGIVNNIYFNAVIFYLVWG